MYKLLRHIFTVIILVSAVAIMPLIVFVMIIYFALKPSEIKEYLKKPEEKPKDNTTNTGVTH